MDRKHIYALRICRPLLLSDLDVVAALDYMYAGYYMNENDYQKIRSKDPSEQASSFITYLNRRSDKTFDNFMNFLSDKQPHIAEEITKYMNTDSHIPRGRENSLSDLREAFVFGTVPDAPSNYLNRPVLIEELSIQLKTLASKFKSSSPPNIEKQFNNITLDIQLDIASQSQAKNKPTIPPPNNAWLLVHGCSGCGKTVVCSSTLRQNYSLISKYFPGGIVWISVGRISSGVDRDRRIVEVLSRLEHLVYTLLTKTPDTDRTFPDMSESLLHGDIRPALRQPPISSSSSHELEDYQNRLRRSLIRLQRHFSWGAGDPSEVAVNLLLIILDDVSDHKLIDALSKMPAAFLVTSRRRDILDIVISSVGKMESFNDLDDHEVAYIMSSWTGRPISRFLDQSGTAEHRSRLDDAVTPIPSWLSPPTPSSASKPTSEHHVVKLCRGSPFASALVGNLLVTQAHRISDYICRPPNWWKDSYLDWLGIHRSGAYHHTSVYEALEMNLIEFKPRIRKYYEQLVIFDADVILPPKAVGIHWRLNEKDAEFVLRVFTNISLINEHRRDDDQTPGFSINALFLDALKSMIPFEKQISYHAQFVANYTYYCSGRWRRLLNSDEHNYFWRQVIEHLFRANNLIGLVNMLTDLSFLGGRFIKIGTTPVIVDFYRYRAVFESTGNIAKWHEFLRFVQTNAYYMINPVIAHSTDRNRSPYRSTSPTGLPDSHSPNRLVSTTSSTLTVRDHGRSRPISPSLPLSSRLPLQDGPLGIDALQVALGLPLDSLVCRHALKDLQENIASDQLRTAFYWFWGNSKVATSQLTWAIHSGLNSVTCFSIEPLNVPSSSGGLGGQRYLVGTQDGRVLLLDADSGYEVAIEQVYPDDIQVKFISFFSKDTECLTGGSDGSFIISALPPQEPARPLTTQFSPFATKNADVFRFPPLSSDLLVDPENEMYGGNSSPDFPSLFADRRHTASAYHYKPGSAFHAMGGNDDESLDEIDEHGEDDDNGGPNSAPSHQSPSINQLANGSPSNLSTTPGFNIASPVVLAKIPRLTEMTRVLGDLQQRRTRDNPGLVADYTLHCIAAYSSMTTIVLSGQTDAPPEICQFLKQPSADTEKKKNGKDRTPTCCQLKLPVYRISRSESNELKLDLQYFLTLNRHEICPPSTMTAGSLLNVKAHLIDISCDTRLIAVGLNNGQFWFYDSYEVDWCKCISTLLVGSGDGDEKSHKINPTEIGVASSCTFVPLSEENQLPNQYLFAAAVGSVIYVWSILLDDGYSSLVPGSIQADLVQPDRLTESSRPFLRLTNNRPLSSQHHISTIDAGLVDGKAVIASGTLDGHIQIWGMWKKTPLLDLTSHTSPVTALSLLASASSNLYDPWLINPSPTPIGLLIGFQDGVVMRWDVGTDVLPSPLTPTPMQAPSSGAAAMDPLHQQHQPDRHSLAAGTGQLIHPPNDSKNAVFGLWTDIFDVWFGQSGSLLIVGCRRHSFDLQLLYRPEISTRPMTVTNADIDQFNLRQFQEMTFKLSQPLSWRPQPHLAKVEEVDSGELTKPSRNGGVGRVITGPKMSEHGPAKTSSLMRRDGPDLRRASEPVRTPLLNLTSSLGDFDSFGQSKATAVKLWPDAHWLAVGLVSGFIQIFSLHLGESRRMQGVVKRFTLVDRLDNSCSSITQSDCSKPVNNPIIGVNVGYDRVPSTAAANPSTLIVVGVYAHGNVCAWYLPRVSHQLTRSTRSDSQVIAAHQCWTNQHENSSSNNGDENHTQSADEAIAASPVTWTKLCKVTPSKAGGGRQYSSRGSANSSRSRQLIVWLTAGTDGHVIGNQLSIAPQPADAPATESSPWSLNLTAHSKHSVVDADVDSSGQWLLTGSDDSTVKIWCLFDGSLIFDTGPNPHSIRSVVFYPTVVALGPQPDSYFAAGTEKGLLLVWCLPTQFFYRSHTSNPLLRTRSPDLLSRPPLDNQPLLQIDSSSNPDLTVSTRTRYIPSGFRHFPAMKPKFYSSAAGYRELPLRQLAWSPDGRMLAGLTDRLCVWPFEPPGSSHQFYQQQHVPPSTASAFSMQQPILHPCRVIRVMSSCFPRSSDSLKRCLAVSRRWHMEDDNPDQVIGDGDDNDGVPSSLPPSVVTVDTNTGTLYVYDPVGFILPNQ